MDSVTIGAVIRYCSILFISISLPFCVFAEESLLDLAIKDHNLSQYEHLSIEKYKIRGRTDREIRESLNNNGPVDHDGIRRDGHTKWHIRWRWPFSSEGKPEFLATTVTLSLQMRLPEWIHDNDVSKDLISRWRKFIDLLIAHEVNHLKFVMENYRQIEVNIRQAFSNNPELTTEEANQIGYKTLNQIRALDRDYDQRTDNGKSEGIRFP